MLSPFSIYISNPLLHSVSGFINLKSYYSLYGTKPTVFSASVKFISHRRLRISHTVAPRSHLLWFVPISYKKFYFLVIHDSRQKGSFCSYFRKNADLLDQIFSDRIISKSGGYKQAKCMEGKMWQMLSASLVSKFWSFYMLLVNLSCPKLTDQNAKHGFLYHLTNSMAYSQVAC